jgi:hypothetical protein
VLAIGVGIRKTGMYDRTASHTWAKAMTTFSKIVTAGKIIWFLIWAPVVFAPLIPVLYYLVPMVGDMTGLYRAENYMFSGDHYLVHFS